MVWREWPVTRAVAEMLTPSTRRLATWSNSRRVQRSRAVSTDILYFRARVLAIQAAEGCEEAAPLIPDKVLPVYWCNRSARFSRRSPPDAGGPWSDGQSARGSQAAASSDGHVSQAADRLASTRDRRAAVARAVRSAGTASPVPKYISSGVWLRNAECGSTRLCSAT